MSYILVMLIYFKNHVNKGNYTAKLAIKGIEDGQPLSTKKINLGEEILFNAENFI